MDDLAAMLSARRKRHGDFTVQARIAQNLKRQVMDEENYARLSAVHREGIEMILHKIARIVAGDPDFHDHWDDIAGYARITRERLPPAPQSVETGERREPRYYFPDGTPLKDGARD